MATTQTRARARDYRAPARGRGKIMEFTHDLPAGVIDSVDADDEKVYVNRTKDEIKNAPEFDEDTYQSDEYRTNLGGYYGRERVGSRDSTDLL